MGLSWVSDVRSLQKPLFLRIVTTWQTISCTGRWYLISVTSFIGATWICSIHDKDTLTQYVEIVWLQANSNRAPTAHLSILGNIIIRRVNKQQQKKMKGDQDRIRAALFQWRHWGGNSSSTRIQGFRGTVACQSRSMLSRISFVFAFNSNFNSYCHQH